MLVKDALMYLIKRLILPGTYKLPAVLISSPEQSLRLAVLCGWAFLAEPATELHSALSGLIDYFNRHYLNAEITK